MHDALQLHTHVRRRSYVLFVYRFFEVFKYLFGGLAADIRGKEYGLQFVVEIVVEHAARKQLIQFIRYRVLGLFECVLYLCE